MRIFATPNLRVAGILDVAKVASSSIARAVIASCYPEIDRQISSDDDYPAGYHRHNIHWQQLAPKLHANNREPVVMLIRCPIARFVAACHQFNVEPAAILAGPVSAGGYTLNFNEPHFRSQSWLRNHHAKKHVVTTYRIEDQLPEFLAATGLPSLPQINTATSKATEKPTLTAAQRNQLQSIYAADLALHAE